MGIRFYCPNGHKLNVKDFLAGKRGICPDCQARFRIPQESQIPKGAPKVRPADEAALAQAAATPQPSAAAVIQESPVEAPAAGPLVSPAPMLGSGSDAFAEAPDAVWYVRPPSGGQYGPARGEVMQRWIAEGRVSADTLVWREGWAEWRSAGPLFPSLSNESPTTSPTLEAPVDLSVASDEDATTSRRSSASLRKSAITRKKSITMVVTLTVVIVALLVALVFVLHGVG